MFNVNLDMLAFMNYLLQKNGVKYFPKWKFPNVQFPKCQLLTGKLGLLWHHRLQWQSFQQTKRFAKTCKNICLSFANFFAKFRIFWQKQSAKCKSKVKFHKKQKFRILRKLQWNMSQLYSQNVVLYDVFRYEFFCIYFLITFTRIIK